MYLVVFVRGKRGCVVMDSFEEFLIDRVVDGWIARACSSERGRTVLSFYSFKRLFFFFSFFLLLLLTILSTYIAVLHFLSSRVVSPTMYYSSSSLWFGILLVELSASSPPPPSVFCLLLLLLFLYLPCCGCELVGVRKDGGGREMEWGEDVWKGG